MERGLGVLLLAWKLKVACIGGNFTSMNAKDLIIDDNTQSEEVKHVRKIVPYIRISIFP
jgi:hypothetical protein